NSNALSNTQSFAGIVPGAYSITQTPVAGWLQEGATCSNGSDPSSVAVAPGENVTCTFVMSRNARIIVRKDAIPDSPQDFDFTAGGGLSPSSFQLDDDGSNSNALSNTRTFIVAPGTGYSV